MSKHKHIPFVDFFIGPIREYVLHQRMIFKKLPDGGFEIYWIDKDDDPNAIF